MCAGDRPTLVFCSTLLSLPSRYNRLGCFMHHWPCTAMHVHVHAGTKEYAELRPTERVEVAVLLCALVADTHAVRQHLVEVEEQRKQNRKEIIDIRGKLKR